MDDDITRRSPTRPPVTQAVDECTVVGKARATGQPTPLKPFASNELGEMLEGSELGSYRLEEFVGGGGMGAVFRATDLLLHRPAAVKVISGRSTDQDAIKRFQVEARSAARLDHQNLARVYNVGEDRGWHFIVFEYIDGVNLRDLVAHKGPLPQSEVVGYILQVAAALDHAASRDVVHRDIKPSNVLVLPDGTIKVVDMGLARFNQLEANEDLTESGMTLGSFDYISPEQARDPRNADVRSDLYSLGCTMYFIVTGQPPFPAGTALQKLLRHSSEKPPDPRTFRPELDPALVAIIIKLLAKQPNQRFQNPRQLIAALLKVAPRVGMRAESGPYVTARPGWAERYLPWALPLAICAAIFAAMVAKDQAEPDVGFSSPELPPGLRAPVGPDAVAPDAAAPGPPGAAPDLGAPTRRALTGPVAAWPRTPTATIARRPSATRTPRSHFQQTPRATWAPKRSPAALRRRRRPRRRPPISS